MRRPPRSNSGFGASTSTSHGASAPRASEIQEQTTTRYVSTNEYVRLASLSSSIEYANAGHAVRNAIIRNTTADEIRTATEYTPTSVWPLKCAMKILSTKLIAQSASAEGTSGSPNRFISRRRPRSNCSPSW